MLSMDDLMKKEETSSDKMTILQTACENHDKGIEYITKLEEQLAKAKQRLKDIEEIEIPDLMDSMNMEKITLTDGRGIVIKEIVAASISEENKPAAHGWLESNGHGDIIKTEVVVKFNREDHKLAKELAAELQARELSVAQKNSVHYQTLGSWVREQLENGVDFPKELFGVFTSRKAVIK